MTYIVDQDQTASVQFGLKLFASILQVFAAEDFSRQHFQMHFRRVLRVNWEGPII